MKADQNNHQMLKLCFEYCAPKSTKIGVNLKTSTQKILNVEHTTNDFYRKKFHLCGNALFPHNAREVSHCFTLEAH